MPVNIQLEWTPNPSTLKYVVDRKLLPSGALQLGDRKAAAEKSPLAEKLFGIPGVTAVMIGTTFVTVTKGGEGEWDEMNDQVMSTLETHLDQNLTVVHPQALERKASATESDVENRIRGVLDEEIRPALNRDGGDVALDRFEDGVAYLYMSGACAGCPSSTMTLKMGIETRLRELVPEVNEVVSL